MSNLGAIPKAKGGARPKTKVVANGSLPCTNAAETFKQQSFNRHTKGLASNCQGQHPSQILVKKDTRKLTKENIPNEYFMPNLLESGSSSKPLEEREISITENGVQIKRPALSPDWVEKRIFMHYTRPPIANPTEDLVIGAVEAWIEQMEFLVDDLSWLLNLPHYRFWSQIVFDKAVQDCLEFYLTAGPRWFDQTTQDENIQAVINEIHQLVFLIYVRMSTYKESKDDFISPSVFGEIIYENYLYDICKVLDICALYVTANRPLLEKMITNIFTNQPKYFEDLAELVQSLHSVLENLQKKLGNFDSLAPRFVKSDITLGLEEIRDVIQYMMDAFYSLQSFLAVFQKASETLHKKEFDLKLASFYESAIPKLIEHLLSNEELGSYDSCVERSLLRDINTIRLMILSIFRENLVWNCLPDNVTKDSRPSSSLSNDIESFTHIVTSCFEEKVFLSDYNSIFNINQDLAYFQERGADMTTLDFMKEAVESVAHEMDLALGTEEPAPPPPNAKIEKDLGEGDASGMNGYYSGGTASISAVEVESLVSSLQDLLPELGSGFLKECLKHYNYSSEEVLNALLEENLPSSLASLDRSLKASPEPIENIAIGESVKPLPSQADRPEVLVNRQNIYDDDEFDVFGSQPTINRAKIHKGKSKKAEFEQDRELNEKVKKIIHQYEWNQGYSIYDDEEKYCPQHSADYEDEYDDTYDDNEAGNIDDFGLDKMKRNTLLTIRGRGALNTPGITFDQDEEEEDEGEKEGIEEKNEEEKGVDKVVENRDYRPKTKFKRANASTKRGNQNWNDEWEGGSTLVFRNTRKNKSASEELAEAETPEVSPEEQQPKSRSSFVPFCENPEETRRHQESKRMNLQFRNKGYCPQPANARPANNQSEDADSSGYRPKTCSKTNKHSGKSWRQGPGQGDDFENRRAHGGKYKEDANHGAAQDRNHRHKMIHKNQQHRNAAQAKYRNNL